MSRRHSFYAPVMQVRQNGYSQGSAFHRIGSAAQLIQQHQRVTMGILNDRDNIGHVGGESTQVLFNTLFISDIREYLFINSQTGTLECRNMKACLPHQCK